MQEVGAREAVILSELLAVRNFGIGIRFKYKSLITRTDYSISPKLFLNIWVMAYSRASMCACPHR
jgi:hypothetical protein